MEVRFGERKNISALTVGGLDGYFALDATPFHFEHCRERFGKMWNRSTKGFFFRHPAGQGENVAAFIIKTEMILGRKSFSKFSKTNFDYILWVQPSVFWKCSRMRRSLLTILLRSGMSYDSVKDNYELALFHEPYMLQTRRAVMRFLFGFTKYIGPSIETSSHLESVGWVGVFHGKDDKYVKEFLVWPGKNPCRLEHDLEAIWM